MSHDKGTNVSRETSRDAGEGEELRESRWNTADAPRSPATPATAQAAPLPQPPTPSLSCLDNARAPRYRTGDISPAAAQHLAAAPASQRLVPADARHLAGDAPAARGASPAAAPRPRSTSPAPPASQRLAGAPPRPHGASPPPANARYLVGGAPPPHGRTTLRRRRPCSAIRVTTPRQQRPRRRAHRASRRCSTSRRPPRTRWSQPHLGGLAMVTRSLLGGGPLGLGGLVARRHLLK